MAAALGMQAFVTIARQMFDAHPKQQQRRGRFPHLFLQPTFGTFLEPFGTYVCNLRDGAPSLPQTLLYDYNLDLYCGPSYWSWLLVLAIGPAYWSWLLVSLRTAYYLLLSITSTYYLLCTTYYLVIITYYLILKYYLLLTT